MNGKSLVAQWIGRLATNLIDPRTRIESLMHDLGGIEITPASEDTPHSVWVTEDQAPKGRAGYYIKRYLPIPYTIASDANAVVLKFTYRKQKYQVSSRVASSAEGNLRLIALALESCIQIVDHGIVGWREVLQPFLTSEQAQEGGAGQPTEEWWRVLRLPPDATPEEIEAAYRTQARKHHPDTGGSHEGFLRVQAAYKAAKAERR